MFRIGQKVVCVDASGPAPLVNGRVYEVADIRPPYIEVVGLFESTHPMPGMLASRFRPLSEKKTDIGVFEEILKRETVNDRAPAQVR